MYHSNECYFLYVINIQHKKSSSVNHHFKRAEVYIHLAKKCCVRQEALVRKPSKYWIFSFTSLSCSNASLYLADDFDDAWLGEFVNKNLTLNLNNTSGSNETSEGVQIKVIIQPDWEVVEGTFEHFKDENFEALLIAVGENEPLCLVC